MGTAKKTAKKKDNGVAVVSAEPTPLAYSVQGPIYVDEALHFSPNDLVRFELAQHKMANSLQSIALKRAEIVQFRSEMSQRARSLDSDLAQLMTISKSIEEAFLAYRAELEKQYKVDFSKTSYDDASGRINVLEEETTK